jgi:outer membrane protein assembly factor BamA
LTALRRCTITPPRESVEKEDPGEAFMSRTKIAAVWFACSLLGVLTGGVVGHAAAQSPPSVITGVAIKGAEHFNASELEQYTNLAKGMSFDPVKASEDCTAIVRHYQEHGYPFATCSQNAKPFMILGAGVEFEQVVYTINEGPKVKVQRVEFVGNKFVGGDVLAEQLECHKRGSSRTNFAAVPTDVIHLTEYYRSFGYLDVSVNYELQWNLDGGEGVIMFHINEGERYKQP